MMTEREEIKITEKKMRGNGKMMMKKWKMKKINGKRKKK